MPAQVTPSVTEVAVKNAVDTSASKTRIYVIATVVTAALAVCAITTLAVMRPDNTSAGTLILGILLPIITAFLGAAVGHLGQQVDGRMTQLLQLVAVAGKAEGKLEAKSEPRAGGVDRRHPNNDPLKVDVVSVPGQRNNG